MKKLLLLPLLLLSSGLFLASCSGEEDEILIGGEEINTIQQDILGRWLQEGTQTYWRFDDAKNGVALGENWDLSDDIHEGEGNKFKWYIQSNGLMVIYLLETTGSYSDPDPDAPFTNIQINAGRMTWDTSTGEHQSFRRVNQ